MVGRKEREFESKKGREGGKRKERDWGPFMPPKSPSFHFFQ